MSRFQAKTNAVLDAELEDLSGQLGLRPNQRAELLREMAALASWVVQQAQAGRRIEARRGAQVEILVHPVLERLRRRPQQPTPRLELTDSEAERLAAILESGFKPTPDLREALVRLADPERHPPRLDWNSAL